MTFQVDDLSYIDVDGHAISIFQYTVHCAVCHAPLIVGVLPTGTPTEKQIAYMAGYAHEHGFIERAGVWHCQNHAVATA